jgi:hypothetical protein
MWPIKFCLYWNINTTNVLFLKQGSKGNFDVCLCSNIMFCLGRSVWKPPGSETKLYGCELQLITGQKKNGENH